MRVCIDRNISSGKSTVLKNIKTLYPVVSEPVEIWENFEGHNFLELLYTEPKRWLFQFQVLVSLTLSEIQNNSDDQTTVIWERCLESAVKVFTILLTLFNTKY